MRSGIRILPFCLCIVATTSTKFIPPSQWKVESEKPYFLQPDFAVTEIEAQKGPIRILVWVWYSGREFSSPSFFGFRRHFRPGGDYYTCQISIPVTTEVAESRKLLLEFVNALSHEVNHDGL